MQDNLTASGGAFVVTQLMRRGLGVELTPDQAEALWSECRTVLQDRKLESTIRAADSSREGSLDTLERDDVRDALAQVLTQAHWPLNGDSNEVSTKFLHAAATSIKQRGYALTPEA